MLFIILLPLAVAYVDGFSVPSDELFRLDIIHHNDFHARFEETSLDSIKCHYNNDSCLGGFPRLYHEIHVLLKDKPDALLLDAGDSFQGTFWYTLLKWNLTQQFMNLLPHDAHTIGNHDFDDGIVGLVPYLASLKAPVVAANMDASKEFLMYGLHKPHVVIERKGKKIGIIGVITPDTKELSSSGKIVFTDPVEATRKEVQELSKKGVDIIIVLSHCGMPVDMEIAKELGEYVDVIVGGHTHRDETVLPPYPVVVQSKDRKHEVFILQAFSFTKYVGNFSIYFNGSGEAVKSDGNLVFLNRSIPEDLSMKSKLEPYSRLVRKVERTPVGKTLLDLKHEGCSLGECALGNLVLDAFVEYAKEKVKSPYDHLAFLQQSQIRFSIRKGPITVGNLVELLPYYDKLITFELEGRRVLKALERSVSDPVSNEPFNGPWFLQVSGLRVSYNVSKPEGSRVTSVLVGKKKSHLDPKGVYQVTLPYYLADGGDGYEIFKFRKHARLIGYDQPALERYIKRHSPLNNLIDGRIRIYK